ncbi:MAG: hypothetical protein QOJ12_1106 [Thermoleophilales bacterium]|nr:hypothetical protein [Thermoleophilales bacterium]
MNDLSDRSTSARARPGRRRRAPLALAALALLTALLPASSASANTTQPTMLQDDGALIYGSQTLRASRLDELRSLGVDIVKVRVRWRDLAFGKKKPGGDLSNPAAYPASRWAPYDAIVRGAADRGMGVLFQLGGTAPDWATPGPSPVNRPNPAEFGKFVKAVGTRYSGSYSDGGSGGYADPLIPAVTLWSVWNEPNLVSWLSPQVSGGVPQAPRIYRGLLNAAAAGLAASGHGNNQLLLGELLPFTRTTRSTSKKLRPLAFLRELACVDSHYRPFRGSAAKKRGCTGFKALPGTGLAYHPYTLAGGPGVPTPNPDDASIANLSRVTIALDRLGARGRLKTRRMPVWITEFGFQSRPPDPYATPLAKIPGFMGWSEWIAFKNPRVVSYSQYPLVDDPGSRSGFQSGLRFHNGKKKPGVFDAFARPLYARKSGSRVELFGGVRAASGGSVQLQTRTSKKGKWTSLGNAALNSRGYFDKRVKVTAVSKRYFRFVGNGTASRAAKVGG